MKSHLVLAIAGVAGLSLVGCAAKESATSQSAKPAGAQIAVNATDTECALSASESPKGTTAFVVTNNGTKPTEFYVYGKDGSVLAEVENISPGLKRDLVVDLNEAGTYKLACKPGMVGDGIRTEFSVKG